MQFSSTTTASDELESLQDNVESDTDSVEIIHDDYSDAQTTVEAQQLLPIVPISNDWWTPPSSTLVPVVDDNEKHYHTSRECVICLSD